MNTILFLFSTVFSKHCTLQHNRKSNKTLVCQINSSVSVETASAWLCVLQLIEPHDSGTATTQLHDGASACWVMEQRNYRGSRAKFDLWERGVVDLHLQMALEQGRKDFQWKKIPLCASDVGGYISHYLAIVRKRVHLSRRSHFQALGEKFFHITSRYGAYFTRQSSLFCQTAGMQQGGDSSSRNRAVLTKWKN